jgi:hypothetical protein
VDYNLWKESIKQQNQDSYISNFQFTFRSSVEHYYPQNPLEGGVQKLDSVEDVKALNSFGNLCLISRSKNSRLSNFSPLQKKEFYKNNEDCIKQRIMMNKYDAASWGPKSIMEHEEEILSLLKLQIQ